MVAFYATERHFLDHLAPIWRALPERGAFHVTPDLVDHAALRGVVATVEEVPERGAVAVASFGDLRKVRSRYRRPIFVEHGCGLSYGNEHGSYSGGRGRGDVSLFVVPNEFAAALNRGRYPHIPTVVVGCPKLDRWHHNPPPYTPGVVCVSFHWDCRVAPETRWAFPHFKRAVADLARTHQVIGHAHPRAFDKLAPWYEDHGIEPVGDFDDVAGRAHCYVVDNSSTLYEFAALDRPTVAMNAPWYRPRATFPPRFWSHIPGHQVARPDRMATVIDQALADPPAAVERRQAVIADVYPHLGDATDRAAAAITEHIDAATRPLYTRLPVAFTGTKPTNVLGRRISFPHTESDARRATEMVAAGLEVCHT